jgi:hypothetical protein
MAYGTINADVIQSSVTGVSLGAGNATRFKNRIINGDMRINQRGASGTVVTGAYQVDRFKCFLDTSPLTLTFAQSSTAPAGFSNSAQFTVTSAGTVTSGQGNTFLQIIEGFNTADLGFGTANAKTVTLSFWVQSSVTGTFGGSLTNGTNTRSYPFTYTISSANTWTQASVTIAGDTSGTWVGSTNAAAMNVWFSFGTGSTLSGTAGSWASANYISATGATNIIGTAGATFYITGVQLEVGSSATGFEYVDYTTQLAMCQRYFQKYVSPHITGVCATSSAASRVGGLFPVVMRADPTTSLAGTINIFDGSGAAAISSINVSYCTTQVIEFDFVTAASLVPYRPAILYVQTGGSLSFSAEL